MSEYVGSYARRLEWLTGFKGSAGLGVVLSDTAAIFVDGRYTLQARDQVDSNHWQILRVPETSVAAWLAQFAAAGMRIGYDPWLHSRPWVERISAALAGVDAELVPVDDNPVDRVWHDRPAPSRAKVVTHPDEFAGKTSSEKRREIADWLHSHGADTVVLSALDSIAWTFNIRGSDVRNTPVALAYALVHSDASADLFVASEKMTGQVAQHLSAAVRVHDRSNFGPDLVRLRHKTVALDPERAVAAIFGGIRDAGANTLAVRDPTVLARAIKNPVEIAGHRAAQARDGAALSRFLHWVAREAPTGKVTELDAAKRLNLFRVETGFLEDLSFETISGAGPNGAVVHYKVDEKSNRLIKTDSLYLVDSGGQYRDGTTDVTRTVAIGEPSAEMRDRFTKVLKGHIALATAVFPQGTRGSQLDTLARQYLWRDGLDYPHATGHGVGSFLSVHEGPQRIGRPRPDQCALDEELRAGMIISNEPGYYKPHEYGIRIENLVLVDERPIQDSEMPMLGFETLTLAPIDRRLIIPSTLSGAEIDWLNTYHRRVLDVIGPLLDADDRSWLARECSALAAS